MKNKFDNWHKSFFSGLWLEVQKKMYSEQQSLIQAKFLIDVLKLRRNQKILDIPCGNGRISNILGKKGMNVTGVDFNEHLLNHARKEAKKQNLKPRFFKLNMFDIEWENEFDAAICFWGSFGYFSEDLNIKFLRNVYDSLKKGGRFLLDAHTAETLFPRYQKKGWLKIQDIYVLEDRTYNVQDSRIEVEWTFIKKGRTEVKRTSIRVYAYHELVNILESIGFKKFTSYSSIEKGSFNFNSYRLYLIAQK